MKKNVRIKSPVAIALVLGMAACGQGETSDNGSSGSAMGGSFRVQVSDGSGFSEASERASIEAATDSMFGFRAGGWHLRVDARGMPDTGSAETTEFGANNTMLTMYVDVGSERKRVGCDPADPETGSFERTHLTETHVSGEFTLEFVTCEDYFSAESVEVPGLPFTVTGSFEGIKRTDQ